MVAMKAMKTAMKATKAMKAMKNYVTNANPLFDELVPGHDPQEAARRLRGGCEEAA